MEKCTSTTCQTGVLLSSTVTKATRCRESFSSCVWETAPGVHPSQSVYVCQIIWFQIFWQYLKGSFLDEGLAFLKTTHNPIYPGVKYTVVSSIFCSNNFHCKKLRLSTDCIQCQIFWGSNFTTKPV